jgi:hypothetical protein
MSVSSTDMLVMWQLNCREVTLKKAEDKIKRRNKIQSKFNIIKKIKENFIEEI